MVPRMADHPIPKLADVVWGFYPEQAEQRRERGHRAWGNLRMKRGPPLRINRQRILVAQNPEQWERNKR